jgi:hypothetical protein
MKQQFAECYILEKIEDLFDPVTSKMMYRIQYSLIVVTDPEGLNPVSVVLSYEQYSHLRDAGVPVTKETPEIRDASCNEFK